jgi:phospholipid transport system substrate-binding protein
MTRKMVILLLLTAFIAVSSPVFAGEPMDQLRTSVEKIIAILKDPSLRSPDRTLDRRNRIFKVVEERFDFSEMARRSLGEFWPKISEAEQREFEVSFSSLLESTYITKIERFSEEAVIFDEERPKGEQYYLVRTEVVSGDRSIPVDYSLRNVNGQWLVYDVNIEEVSLVAGYRTQFAETFRKEGFRGLMKKIGEDAQKLGEV